MFLKKSDNNITENPIRQFVVGRKNQLFANTQRDTDASACLFSMVESAIANVVDPFDYFAWLFTELPKARRFLFLCGWIWLK
jgi:transposase